MSLPSWFESSVKNASLEQGKKIRDKDLPTWFESASADAETNWQEVKRNHDKASKASKASTASTDDKVKFWQYGHTQDGPLCPLPQSKTPPTNSQVSPIRTYVPPKNEPVPQVTQPDGSWILRRRQEYAASPKSEKQLRKEFCKFATSLLATTRDSRTTKGRLLLPRLFEDYQATGDFLVALQIPKLREVLAREMKATTNLHIKVLYENALELDASLKK